MSEHRAPGGWLSAGIACHQTTAGWSFLFLAWIVVVRTVGLRRRARELAMRALYETDIGRQSLATVVGRVAPEVPDREQAFFRALCEGTWRERERIDALLAELTPQWSVERLASTDRAILRIAMYELQHLPTPPRVVVNGRWSWPRRMAPRPRESLSTACWGRCCVAG